MERMLAEALRAGFVGMSSQQLLFDKLDGDVCRSRTLPSTYAKPRELRRLKSLLRRAGRVLQSGPDIQNPLNLGSQLAQSLGIFRNPLKTSLLSAADVKSNPYAILMPWARRPAGQPPRRQLPLAASARAVRGLRRRHRPGGLRGVRRRRRGTAPARRGRAQRADARRGVPPRVPQGVREQVRGAGVAPRLLRRRDRRVPRRVGGRQVVRRGRPTTAAGCTPSTRSSTWCSSTARRCVGAPRSPTTGPRCSRSWHASPASRWASPMRARTCATWRSTTWACGCCATSGTRETAGKPFMTVEQAVHRLTGELADWYRLDAGHLRIGDRADVVIIDPERLDDVAGRLRRGTGRAVRRTVADGQPQRRDRHRRVRRRPCGVPRRQGHRARRHAAHRPLPARRAPGRPRSPTQKDELASVG